MPTNASVYLQDVCEVEEGVLKSVDLSKLYFPDDEEPGQDIRLVRVAPKPTSLLALPKMTRRALVELTLTRTSQPASRVLPRVSLRPFRKAESSPTIRPLPRATYSVKRSLDQSLLGGLLAGTRARQERIEIELPFGAPRCVSAATLKVMLGADDEEALFKKTGKRWEICPIRWQRRWLFHRELS